VSLLNSVMLMRIENRVLELAYTVT
jgi:hypothetical protein